VTGHSELRELERVDMQQRAALGPLVAAGGRWPLSPALAADAVTVDTFQIVERCRPVRNCNCIGA
jgi:hypothetical protein